MAVRPTPPALEALESRIFLSGDTPQHLTPTDWGSLIQNGTSQSGQSQQDFQVFDATLFKGRPDLYMAARATRLQVIYGGQLWSPGADQSQPDEVAIRKLARSLAPGSLVCLDLEGPGWDNFYYDQLPRINVEVTNKFIQVATWFREENPTAKLGFFGVAPIPEMAFWAYRAGDTAARANWVEANRLQREMLQDYVDVIFPEYYPRYLTAGEMYDVGKLVLQEAQKYGKPVYPFIWDKYWRPLDNVAISFQPIPWDLYQSMLQASRDYADGVVMWGGYDCVNGAPEEWSSAQAQQWFGNVQSWLLDNGIFPPLVSQPDRSSQAFNQQEIVPDLPMDFNDALLFPPPGGGKNVASPANLPDLPRVDMTPNLWPASFGRAASAAMTWGLMSESPALAVAAPQAATEAIRQVYPVPEAPAEFTAVPVYGQESSALEQAAPLRIDLSALADQPLGSPLMLL